MLFNGVIGYTVSGLRVIVAPTKKERRRFNQLNKQLMFTGPPIQVQTCSSMLGFTVASFLLNVQGATKTRHHAGRILGGVLGVTAD